MTTHEQVTFGIAVAGAVLGIINTWRSFDRDTLRLLVTPAHYTLNTGDSGFCIEIINRGYLPVTIEQAGFYNRRTKQRQTMVRPWQIAGGESLPHRLEPRTAITVYFPPGADRNPTLLNYPVAYAKTACGRIFTGNSPAYKAHLKELRRAS